MGDIADTILERMDDTFDDYDAWEDGFCPKRVKKIPACRYCGKTPLRWRQINDKWVLHEMDGHYHDCPEHPLLLNVLKDILAQQKRNI